MSEWQAITTAPKSRRPIIYMSQSGAVGRCYWDEGDGIDPDVWWDIDADQEVLPEFWMPLPPPPDRRSRT